MSSPDADDRLSAVEDRVQTLELDNKVMIIAYWAVLCVISWPHWASFVLLLGAVAQIVILIAQKLPSHSSEGSNG